MFVLQLLTNRIINVVMTLLTNYNDILTLKTNWLKIKIWGLYRGKKNVSYRSLWFLLFVFNFSGYIILSGSIFTLLYFYKYAPLISNLLINHAQFVMFTCYNDLPIINLQIFTFPLCKQYTLFTLVPKPL